jgi:O-antigen/teichoic acid export membrane protein
VAVGITLFVGDLLRVMSDPGFHAAADVVPLILVAYVLQSWAQAQDIGILVRERTEYVTLANWIAAGVALAGYWYLVPRYLEWGAAVATLAAFVVRYGFTYFFSQRLWHVEYRWTPVLRLVGLAVAVGLVGVFLPDLRIWESVAVRTLLFGVYLVGVWTLGVLTDRERQRFLQLGRKAWVTIRGMVARKLPAY